LDTIFDFLLLLEHGVTGAFGLGDYLLRFVLLNNGLELHLEGFLSLLLFLYK